MENQETTETNIVEKQEAKKREIRKVAVSVGGLKGLVLSGTIESVEKNKPIINGFVNTIRHPIHKELEDKIADLRAHWLEITGLVTDTTKKDKVFELREGCEILAIEFELGQSGFFKIKAMSRVLDSKFQTITTPKVDESDNYEYFNEVMDLIKEILVEVDHYENKTKIISNEELFISYIKHGKGVGINMDEYEAMDRDTKAEYLTKLLTKEGFIANVLDTQDMDEEEMEEVESTGEDIDDGDKPTSTGEMDFSEPDFESQPKGK